MFIGFATLIRVVASSLEAAADQIAKARGRGIKSGEDASVGVYSSPDSDTNASILPLVDGNEWIAGIAGLLGLFIEFFKQPLPLAAFLKLLTIYAAIIQIDAWMKEEGIEHGLPNKVIVAVPFAVVADCFGDRKSVQVGIVRPTLVIRSSTNGGIPPEALGQSAVDRRVISAHRLSDKIGFANIPVGKPKLMYFDDNGKR
ncbi:hypothetical protein F5Y18DRAFT_431527 [Xylariaceae sp. FL1019]|nr:hypothetical protein F5Y18DRAFT_431527 [Xylariaceae sp. FL1019]